MRLPATSESPAVKPTRLEKERYVELPNRVKMTAKASPIQSPIIVAFVNLPFTQYRTRIPIVPSGLARLIVEPGPHPSPQLAGGIRPPVSHRSQYLPDAANSQYLLQRQSFRDRLSRFYQHVFGQRLDHVSRVWSSRPYSSDHRSNL